METGKSDIEQNKEFYAIVGELVLLSTALDTLLNSVMIEVLHLGYPALADSFLQLRRAFRGNMNSVAHRMYIHLRHFGI
jgi:hypothetical protein